MAIITQGKGGLRQIILIVILVIIAVGLGIYLYSSREPAPSPSAKPGKTPEVRTPSRTAERVTPRTETPQTKQERGPLKTTFDTEVLRKLKKLNLVLHGDLPIKVSPGEIGRNNPFLPPK